MASDLPAQHRALVLESVDGDFKVKELPTPQATSGSVVVRVLSAGVLSYHREVYNGQRHYSFPTPLVPGISAVGRVAQVGPDSTILKPGMLVFVDCVIRARDDPSAVFLTALHDGSSDGSRKLMREVWRDGMFAQYANAPLENCIPLDETKLCRTLGYSSADLAYLYLLLVPYGGLRDIQLQPGETVVIFPATGGFGSAGVLVACAMGARVIALGRNERELARVKKFAEDGIPGSCVEIVKMSGDQATDTAALQAFGTVDAVLDLSPPAMVNSTHIPSAIMALRHGGRVSLMGVADFPIPAWKLVGDDIALKGKLMYSREDMVHFVKMLERGMFPKGAQLVDTKAFALDDIEQALTAAAEHTGIGKVVVIEP